MTPTSRPANKGPVFNVFVVRSKKVIIHRVVFLSTTALVVAVGSYLYQHFFGRFDDTLAAYLKTCRIPILSSFSHLTIRNGFWLPFYCSVILFAKALYQNKIFSILIFLGLLMMVSDYITIIFSHLFSVNYLPETIINPNQAPYNSIKGSFDFAYMHAACAFALVIFLMLLFNQRYFLLQVMLVLWALLISYNWLFEAQNHVVGVMLEIVAGSIAGAQAYKIYRQHFLIQKLEYEN